MEDEHIRHGMQLTASKPCEYKQQRAHPASHGFMRSLAFSMDSIEMLCQAYMAAQCCFSWVLEPV
ncbi:MAG: hypothetical protein PHV32_12990 [Eubacteriales bacterium]|nr:hypothetical protein [Eubacteriales bacterium]